MIHAVLVGLGAIVSVGDDNSRNTLACGLVLNQSGEVVHFENLRPVDADFVVHGSVGFLGLLGLGRSGRIFKNADFRQPEAFGTGAACVVEGQKVGGLVDQSVGAGARLENVVLGSAYFDGVGLAVGLGELAAVGVNLTVIESYSCGAGSKALDGISAFAVEFVYVGHLDVGPFGTVVLGRKHPVSADGGGGEYFFFGAAKSAGQKEASK